MATKRVKMLMGGGETHTQTERERVNKDIMMNNIVSKGRQQNNHNTTP